MQSVREDPGGKGAESAITKAGRGEDQQIGGCAGHREKPPVNAGTGRRGMYGEAGPLSAVCASAAGRGECITGERALAAGRGECITGERALAAGRSGIVIGGRASVA